VPRAYEPFNPALRAVYFSLTTRRYIAETCHHYRRHSSESFYIRTEAGLEQGGVRHFQHKL